MNDYIKIEVWDENNEAGASDNLIGCIPIRYSRILEGMYKDPFW